MSSKTSQQLQGQAAEEAAQTYLEHQGLRLIERNFHCKMGEIDLIMQEAATLVFVEVRFRRNQAFGGAAASVTSSKQRKLHKTAALYLQRFNKQPPCRFDVIAMSVDSQGRLTCENWIKNAF